MQATLGRRATGARARWGALGCVLLLMLAGCVAGDGVQASFVQQFSKDPAVERVDLTTVDNMPFTGGVSGTVFLRDDLSEAEVRDFAERVGDFGDDNTHDGDDARVRIDLAVDDWTFPVLIAPDANNAVLDLVYQLRADPRVGVGTLSSKDYASDVDHVSLIATATTWIPALITEAPAAFSAEGMTPSIALNSPADEPGSLTITGRLGPWAQSAYELYDALHAQVSLTSFRAEEEAITVTLAQESDLDRAHTIADTLLDQERPDVFYASDLVTLFPGARGDNVRTLLATLSDDARAQLVSVWTDDSSATLAVDSTAPLTEIAHTISTNRDSITLSAVTLAVGHGDALTFSLQAAPADLGSMMDAAVTLKSEEHVVRLTVKPGFSLALDLDSSVSDDDLARYAPLLKALSSSGERLCVDWTTALFCTVAAPTIDPSTIRGGGAERAPSFVEAWNSAR